MVNLITPSLVVMKAVFYQKPAGFSWITVVELMLKKIQQLRWRHQRRSKPPPVWHLQGAHG
jgi:hypothetical protein